MSDSADGFPATLELQWNEPIAVRRVELIFDTGMHRVLTLSHSDAYVEHMQWGRPQIETVRDYTIELSCEDCVVGRIDIDGNYQRRRVHELAGRADTVRVIVRATNSLDHARICSVRVVS
jgi:hypothetical protein